ncbi:putative gustatory receptor 10b [Drosophila subpulchrella]|uniref:putative gustatory receptor 10b n=1 Tax=Drosophila subpulchrella TaxID=1486046 RepID=UPI0018A15921|nr:putative gustatory receptor 10b [Drosophila subpulchrella]
MGVARFCRMALRLWWGVILVLALSCHFYSPSRRRLVHSRLLAIYSWLIMAANLVLFYAYYICSSTYFADGTFEQEQQQFMDQIFYTNIVIQFVSLIVQILMRVLREREVCQAYNEVSEILEQELNHQEPSRFYCRAFLIKIHNFVNNFNFVLSILLIWGTRSFELADIFSNLYFVYNSLTRDAAQMAYILLLLDLSEALRLNGQRKQRSYGQLMEQLRRQERLLGIGRRVHRMFAWLVAITLFFQLYYNTSTIYLGYAIIIEGQGALGMPIYSMKVLFTALSFLVILGDGLLLQIVCEHLMAEENEVCTSPRLRRRDEDAKAAHRQWELSVLRRAIRSASPENEVLGMFTMDMQCAFALISSSLANGIIIIQMGYV